MLLLLWLHWQPRHCVGSFFTAENRGSLLSFAAVAGGASPFRAASFAGSFCTTSLTRARLCRNAGLGFLDVVVVSLFDALFEVRLFDREHRIHPRISFVTNLDLPILKGNRSQRCTGRNIARPDRLTISRPAETRQSPWQKLQRDKLAWERWSSC